MPSAIEFVVKLLIVIPDAYKLLDLLKKAMLPSIITGRLYGIITQLKL